MKNMIFLLLLSTMALANSVEGYSARCLSAGGYYGNVSAKALADGNIKVIAAQGFGYNLSQKLHLDPSHTFSTVFNQDNCKARKTAAGNNVLSCTEQNLEFELEGTHASPTTQVINAELVVFTITEALLESVEGVQKSFIVSLYVKILNDKGAPVTAQTSFTFTETLVGGCKFGSNFFKKISTELSPL